MRHLTTLHDLTSAEIKQIFARTRNLKESYRQELRAPLLPGHVLALLFEKPSLRTRVSFETAMAHLGGTSLMLGDDTGFGRRESIGDFARVLSQYVDVVVVRAKRHETVRDFARHATCPVINGLTNQAHPCQALADLYTLGEQLDELQGRRLAFVGDGNNVVKSLAVGCAKLGLELAVASPRGYELDEEFLAELGRVTGGGSVVLTADPRAAVDGAAAVYTDVWASMGQEKQRSARQRAFASFQVNEALMRSAPPEAVFLHCLPAHRGEEVTDEVIDGPQSVVVQQAGNRMHVQKGILAWMLEELRVQS